MDLKSKVQAAITSRPKFPSPPKDGDGILDEPAVKQAPESRHVAQEARKPVPASDRAVPTKGSRRAPHRESTLDAGDGRSRRARGRNSRVSTNVLPEHCDAFKFGCDDLGLDYCVVLEDMIQRQFPELVAEMAKKYDEMYGRRK